MLETLGKREFYAAVRNELSLQFCNIQSLETFKNSINTFPFRKFFEK